MPRQPAWPAVHPTTSEYAQGILAWASIFAAMPVWLNGGAPPPTDALFACRYYRPVFGVVTPAALAGAAGVCYFLYPVWDWLLGPRSGYRE